MGYKNKAAQREYQRAWMRERRIQLITLLGDHCIDCDTTENLEFDHDNLELKRMSASAILSRNWNKPAVAEEIKKLVLRCSDCHRQKTKSEIIPAKHGTDSRYGNGCRCLKCKEAHAQYRYDRRQVGGT